MVKFYLRDFAICNFSNFTGTQDVVYGNSKAISQIRGATGILQGIGAAGDQQLHLLVSDYDWLRDGEAHLRPARVQGLRCVVGNAERDVKYRE